MSQVSVAVIGCIGEKVKKALQTLGRLGTPPECEYEVLRMLMRYLSPDEFDLLHEYKAAQNKASYNKWMLQVFINSGYYEDDGEGNVRIIQKVS